PRLIVSLGCGQRRISAVPGGAGAVLLLTEMLPPPMLEIGGARRMRLKWRFPTRPATRPATDPAA
ncbi:MAG: hypothetical protein OXU71_09790, partial [Gammaproteobacteria bacterium]|nr:hypothetical protein [Gammaproteobacteria bacterium]